MFYWGMSQQNFHPIVQAWFEHHFSAATECQNQAWPAIRSGQHTLIAAPTGSGKTLAAFLCAIDDLLCAGLERGYIEDSVQVLYVSPLKALSNDVHKNLQLPLQGIRRELDQAGLSDIEIRALVRTGDTPAGERARMRQQPPHILVTTPESLYILLTSESGRSALSSVRTVIVDEIHAMAGNKRGAHLALSLQRLTALTDRPPVRIGLSATQKPVNEIANFLIGNTQEPRQIVDIGHQRQRDITLELTSSPLEAVMAGEHWNEIYDRLAELVQQHKTTLIFVNTRRLAERAARHLAERLGEEAVTSHHGSLAREHRLDAEQRLKNGSLKALVATASLELGIDIGDIDLVCQIGSPRLISTFLQRVGRAGHAVGAIPKGRLFPCTRDDLVECTALLMSIQRDELELLEVPPGSLDVLAQQIIAETATREWSQGTLLSLYKGAWPYRELSDQQFLQVIDMVANGFSTQRGRRGAYIHQDAVNQILRGRKSARLTALTNGGTIPDQFDYDVIMQPENHFVGTLNEDFAFESLPGDIFQLGNTSYRILKVERSVVRVEDAQGMPPNIPFWFGEAPGRSDELSLAVSNLRTDFDQRWDQDKDSLQPWLLSFDLPSSAIDQLVEYLGTSRLALGVLPTQQQIIFERFFDESGDTHLVIHSPFGSRINRAWGLALRKRFCRRFNFELQAAALEDTIVMSLSATHSFPLDEIKAYLSPENVEAVLIQALLDTPMFTNRWRWNATTALALRRMRNGQRVPPQIQRMAAEDLIAVVFPDQLACQENLSGEREVPDHPLVQQTIHDCLHEAMDLRGLTWVLSAIQTNDIHIETRDMTLPSPLAQEVLNARPYAFLDDAPAEERRTSAVQARGFLDADTAASLGRLDPDAIEKVCAQAWPEARDMDELHDALVLIGAVTAQEGKNQGWLSWFESLCADHRASETHISGQVLWIAAERLGQWRRVHPELHLTKPLPEIDAARFRVDSRESAVRELVRSRLECVGPVIVSELAGWIVVREADIDIALAALEQEGFAMRGRYKTSELEWCERRLLARINKYTVERLRKEIEPVSAADYMRFLLDWQGLGEAARREGKVALANVLDQLQGFNAPVKSWQRDLLPARLDGYRLDDLDQECLGGRVIWIRHSGDEGSAQMTRAASIQFTPRKYLGYWKTFDAQPQCSALAYQVLDVFKAQGAIYFDELLDHLKLSEKSVMQGLRELVAKGLVNNDSFTGLEELLTSNNHQIIATGRWSLIRGQQPTLEQQAQHIAQVLLRRYGVVFRKVLEREAGLVSWRELLWAYRKMEARGEIRGGRFVSGFSGEQFALPEAVGLLRKMRHQERNGELVSISAADPLNLIGIILPGEKIPSHATQQVVLCDGLPVALKSQNQLQFLADIEATEQWRIRSALLDSYQVATSIN